MLSMIRGVLDSRDGDARGVVSDGAYLQSCREEEQGLKERNELSEKAQTERHALSMVTQLIEAYIQEHPVGPSELSTLVLSLRYAYRADESQFMDMAAEALKAHVPRSPRQAPKV